MNFYILLIITNISSYSNVETLEFRTEKKCKEAMIDIVQLYKKKNVTSPALICLKK